MNLTKNRIIAIENSLNLYCQNFDEEFYEYLFLNLKYTKSFGNYIISIWNFCGNEKFAKETKGEEK